MLINVLSFYYKITLRLMRSNGVQYFFCTSVHYTHNNNTNANHRKSTGRTSIMIDWKFKFSVAHKESIRSVIFDMGLLCLFITIYLITIIFIYSC